MFGTKSFLKLLLSLQFLVYTGVNGSAKNENKKAKNIILILADDMGYHLSCAGTPGIKTPNIDNLAKNGVSFSEAFSVCSSCSPSRSSILTGMYPHANGHWRNTFGPKLEDPDEAFLKNSKQSDIVGVHDWVQTLPELLNKSGYYTAIMSKFHLSFPHKYPFSGRYPTKTNKEEYYKDIRQIINDAGEQPFFIQANISPPHRPFKKQANLYDGEWPDQNELEVFAYLPDMDEVREDLLYYYVSVMLTDQITGRILDALKDAGKDKETLVIFTSDHGPAFHRSKATAYYAGSHIPLVFRGENVLKSTVNNELVSLIDVLPTMLDYVELSIPKQVQGKSLLPIVKEGKGQLAERDYIFTTHNSHGPIYPEFYPSRAIYDGAFYLIKNLKPDKSYLLPADLYQGEKPWKNLSYPAIVEHKVKVPEHYRAIVELEKNRPMFELYDMKNDPGQMNNMYGEPNFDVIRIRLEKKLQQWQQATGDTVLNEMIKTFTKP